jgi:hypothetical protein
MIIKITKTIKLVLNHIMDRWYKHVIIKPHENAVFSIDYVNKLPIKIINILV